jgi:ABC-type bacteriocin/lantibiotic exporter with double-glycine peptidase domain
MKIKKGEKIALIGDSGSGKTTFLKLMRGLYHPQTASIIMKKGKVKLEVNDLDRISDGISLIPQDPELFTSTIRENITMGISCDDETLVHFTDAACFTDVISRLPNKLDSSIKEKGVNLSGGEKQRLALCRGLLASVDKEIIMLDEPTSSVDSRNEMKIYNNIYFFDKGKIIASGKLNDLLEKSPEFKKLWDKYHRQKKEE